MPKFTPLIFAALFASLPARAQVDPVPDVLSKVERRQRLAACATEWQQMKRNGTEGNLIWREFSQICMARRARSPAASQKENASPIR